MEDKYPFDVFFSLSHQYFSYYLTSISLIISPVFLLSSHQYFSQILTYQDFGASLCLTKKQLVAQVRLLLMEATFLAQPPDEVSLTGNKKRVYMPPPLIFRHISYHLHLPQMMSWTKKRI